MLGDGSRGEATSCPDCGMELPADGALRGLTSHGNRVQSVALDSTGAIAVTGDYDSVVRVGPVTGEEPHLLYGHTLEVSSVAFSGLGNRAAIKAKSSR